MSSGQPAGKPRFAVTPSGFRYQFSGPAPAEEPKLDTTISDPSWSSTQQARAALSADDCAAIVAVSRWVTWSLDLRRFDMVEELLCDDFEHISGLLPADSRSAFLALVQEAPALLSGVRQELGNAVAWSLGSGGARLMGYLTITQFAVHPSDETVVLPRLVGHGFVLDDLRKDRGRWRLARRTIDQLIAHPDWLRDPQQRARCALTQAPHPRWDG